MATERVQLGPIPRQWQSFIKRTKSNLDADVGDDSDSDSRTLLGVLESLPTFESFVFREVTLHDAKAISFNIGYREQSDNILLRSNTYILLDDNQVSPPVLFCDEIPAEFGSDAPPPLTPRAATSLLRKAGNLSPPFCFLQFDGGNKTYNVRSMVCALVLYYGLTSGLSDAAIKWNRFEFCLARALEYINSDFEYSQWLDTPAEARDTTVTRDESTSVSEGALESPGQLKETVPDADNDIDMDSWASDGFVRSTGSSVVAKPRTTLAKFKNIMGDKIKLLDAIPDTPIKFEKQTVYPNYAQFRIYFGSYHGCPVYVYRAIDKKAGFKIIAHKEGGGEENDWTFFTLSGLELVSPFNLFMQGEHQDLAASANKIRYLVYYYLMLAENDGVIGNARLVTSLSSMKSSFCAACNNLEKAAQSVANNDGESTSSGASAERQPSIATSAAAAARSTPVHRKPSENIPESLVVKLSIDPKIIAAIIGEVVPHPSVELTDNETPQIDGVADSEDEDEDREEDFGRRDATDGRRDRAGSRLHTAPREPSVDSVLGRASSSEAANAQLHFEQVIAEANEDIDIETDLRDDSRNPSRDSGFASSSAPPLSSKTATPDRSRPGSIVDPISGSITDTADGFDEDPMDGVVGPLPEVEVALRTADVEGAPLEPPSQMMIDSPAVEDEEAPLEPPLEMIIDPPVALSQKTRLMSVSAISIGSSIPEIQGDITRPAVYAPRKDVRSATPPASPQPMPRQSVIIDLEGESEDDQVTESRKAEMREMLEPAPAPVPASASAAPARPRQSVVIDLGGDSEDDKVAESSKAEVKETPDVDRVLNPRPYTQVISSDDDELPLPSPRKGVKRKAYVPRSNDEDDMCEVEGREAWQKASLRQTQTKETYPGEGWRD